MKLPNFIRNSHQSFASVFLAFSLFGLFGFLFPHQTNQEKGKHQVNLRMSQQAAQPERADDGSQYEWFY
jgi:hypothetical protein